MSLGSEMFLNATAGPDTAVVNSTMDWLMSKVDQFPIKLSFFFACSMVLGSVVPYIPQYFTIKQSQNTEGFSLYVCLSLLVANILRIMFWFGKHFETALLIQSIVMIFAMFALLELCVRVRNSNLIIQGRRHYFADFDLRYFWEWTDFISYLECMAIFAFFTGLFMFFFIGEPLVVETYGLVALVTESLLASPQFYRNWKSKSTEGMSRMMVFTWLIGDLYKTIYFVVRDAPFQFWLCGFTQITFDCLIFFQVAWYQKRNYRKLSKSRTLKHLEDRARKRFNSNLRAKKMINLLSTMTNTASDNTPDAYSDAGPSSMVVATVERGHCNPLDDTIVAHHSRDLTYSARVLDSSNSKRLSKSKKTSLELVPIVSGSHAAGGYVNEAAIDERSDSKDSLTQLVHEYRLEEDSDDSSLSSEGRQLNLMVGGHM